MSHIPRLQIKHIFNTTKNVYVYHYYLQINTNAFLSRYKLSLLTTRELNPQCFSLNAIYNFIKPLIPYIFNSHLSHMFIKLWWRIFFLENVKGKSVSRWFVRNIITKITKFLWIWNFSFDQIKLLIGQNFNKECDTCSFISKSRHASWRVK